MERIWNSLGSMNSRHVKPKAWGWCCGIVGKATTYDIYITWALIPVLAASLLIQFSADELGKAGLMT